MFKWATPLFALLLVGSIETWAATAEEDSAQLHGEVYDTRTGEQLSSEALLRIIVEAPVVLIGEKHDNPYHHQIETSILEEILDRRTAVSLVLEMLTEDQQPGIAEVTADDSPKALRAKLNWNERGWPWYHYGSLVEAAVRGGAQLVAGNLSRDQIRSIYSEGQQAIERDTTLSSVAGVSQAIRAELLDTIYIEHCETMPKDRLTPMVDIQLARDARMAHRLVNTATSGSVVLVAGGYHVRKDKGVPLHLRAMTPSVEPLVLLLIEQEAQDTGKAAALIATYQEEADYLWITPAVAGRDYCSEMRTKAK